MAHGSVLQNLGKNPHPLLFLEKREAREKKIFSPLSVSKTLWNKKVQRFCLGYSFVSWAFSIDSATKGKKLALSFHVISFSTVKFAFFFDKKHSKTHVSFFCLAFDYVCDDARDPDDNGCCGRFNTCPLNCRSYTVTNTHGQHECQCGDCTSDSLSLHYQRSLP